GSTWERPAPQAPPTLIRPAPPEGGTPTSPAQFRRVEDRSVDADALVVVAGRRLDHRHATEADADAAGHRRFQGDVARDAARGRRGGKGVKHRLGAAAEEMGGGGVRGEEVGDEAAEAERAVVAGEVDLGPGRAEVIDAGRQLRGAHAVVDRN